MDDQDVKFRMEQTRRYATISAAIEGRLSNEAEALGLSVRQVQRIKRQVEAGGPEAVRHGNSHRDPSNKTPQNLRERVIALATTDYADFNFSHLADILAERHGIVLSAETPRLWLRPLGHGSAPRTGWANCGSLEQDGGYGFAA